LLDKFTQHVTVSVLDPGFSHGGGIGSGSDIGRGTRVPGPKTAWPPIAKYRLSQFPSLSMMFLVGGETPVYHYRVESDGYEDAPDSPASPHGGRDSYRAEYLANFSLYPSLKKRPDAYPDVRLVWLGAESYPAQLAAKIDERRKLFLATRASER
jgi:hypothetical protein